jgi:hypothetical protein
VRRTKSCFFETDSWFRVSRDGNGPGALLGSGSGSFAKFAAIRRAAFQSVFPTVRVRSVSDAGQLFTGQTGDLFFARMRGLPLAMTARTILTPAVAIMIGPSLAFGSPACMTESEALAKFPKATHLYMRQNCWSNSAVAPVHSPRPPPHAAVPAPSARPALAVAPETVNSGTDAGVQCQYLPCE